MSNSRAIKRSVKKYITKKYLFQWINGKRFNVLLYVSLAVIILLMATIYLTQKFN